MEGGIPEESQDAHPPDQEEEDTSSGKEQVRPGVIVQRNHRSEGGAGRAQEDEGAAIPPTLKLRCSDATGTASVG